MLNKSQIDMIIHVLYNGEGTVHPKCFHGGFSSRYDFFANIQSKNLQLYW